MKIEEQVTSLELSKKLKELGVKQESLFYWYTSEFGEPHIENKPSEDEEAWQSVSAFTVAEMGTMLPAIIESPPYTLHYLKQGDLTRLWTINLIDDFRHKIEYVAQEKTEADVRAKMLIYLIENSLLESQAQQQTLPEGHVR